jgi:hypothetical protein
MFGSKVEFVREAQREDKMGHFDIANVNCAFSLQ